MGHLLHDDDAQQHRRWLDGAAEWQDCRRYVAVDMWFVANARRPAYFQAVARERRWRMGYTCGTRPGEYAPVDRLAERRG
jgi:hypothetical protein